MKFIVPKKSKQTHVKKIQVNFQAKKQKIFLMDVFEGLIVLFLFFILFIFYLQDNFFFMTPTKLEWPILRYYSTTFMYVYVHSCYISYYKHG